MERGRVDFERRKRDLERRYTAKVGGTEGVVEALRRSEKVMKKRLKASQEVRGIES